MAANFFNTVKEAWGIPIIWLYCAWHFKEAVMTRIDKEFLNKHKNKGSVLCERIKNVFFLYETSYTNQASWQNFKNSPRSSN